ncbi:hypothetical protein GCM10010912_24910 [Paenibacillus albidus]|uniref:Uncharacterized protein n=1 Tax=Paenibacillus albidus TaxID=2041023 RepID=A0A917FI17_9BACL|nr:hypothetical protein [Paenibacillus albidus]GGF78875.1 hypothetical protein GCM10010912_24910 [Paenibacillus albidus]
MKKAMALIALALFAITALMTIYSFVFPFEAGQRLQGLWFGMIVVLCPVGLVLGVGSIGNPQPKFSTAAIIGHIVLAVFLVLYMTLGYLVFGV